MKSWNYRWFHLIIAYSIIAYSIIAYYLFPNPFMQIYNNARWQANATEILWNIWRPWEEMTGNIDAEVFAEPIAFSKTYKKLPGPLMLQGAW